MQREDGRVNPGYEAMRPHGFGPTEERVTGVTRSVLMRIRPRARGLGVALAAALALGLQPAAALPLQEHESGHELEAGIEVLLGHLFGGGGNGSVVRVRPRPEAL